ncbi:MAG: hypothetical protein K0R83_641 [Caulobacter sp.]|jgi:hypothetical protein|nr:hypothetical protein [Caulobacter sp.]
MASFPKIDGPCPYLDRLGEIMDGDHCRMCQRTVTDLTEMTEAARARFLASCSGETCVTYRFPMKASAAAAAIAASLVALPVAAAPAQPVAKAPAEAPKAAPADAQDEDDIDPEVIVITGGRIARPILDVPAKPLDPKAQPAPADKPAAKPVKGS